MKKILFLILIIPLIFSFGQNRFQQNSFYLSANFGLYKNTDGAGFDNLGSQRYGGGIGIGFRIYDRLSFYLKSVYVARSDFRGYFDNSYLDTEFRTITNIGLADASMNQLVVNGGLQYSILVYEDFVLGILGGLTYTMINQEAVIHSGQKIKLLENEWFYGYFGGLIIEKHLMKSNLSLFAEAVYNYIDDSSMYYRDIFSGTNFTIGGRYYFKTYN
ncbi:MAG: hypothetical protein JW995_02660 [Melioribacteraceae bacterium]|nr:hypothetical protein [Melioribacteraceae bacterium]